MSKERILEIYRRIGAQEPGFEHGHFLTHFARAVMQADEENFEILCAAAEALVVKYKLDKEGEP